MMDVGKRGVSPRSAVFALLCAVLILIAGFAQANHVHNDRSGASHECSLCSVAHAGAIVSAAYQLGPLFLPEALTHSAEVSPKPLFFTAFLYIRPPPSILEISA